MSDFLETKVCDSASEFLDFLQLRNSRWLPEEAISSPWVFRGQSNSQWGLIPSALREDQYWFEPFKNRLAANVKNSLNYEQITYLENEFQPDKNSLERLILQIAAEWNAVDDFVDLADQVGHQIPSDDAAILGGDKNKKSMWEIIIDSFGSYSSKHRTYNRFDPSRVKFALAQHHGIPTRLLDWTYSPLVAAFFAAEEIINKNQNYDEIAVWAINRNLLDETDIKIVAHKRAKISYLHAQSGLFIYDSMTNLEFLRYGFWRSIEQALKTTKPLTNAILRKITLPSSEVEALLRFLSAEGVTRAHIMPTFDNVTETLKMKRKISSIY